jgi:chaperonin GroEL
MAEKKEGRVVLAEEALRTKFMEGAKAAYDAAAMSYGPKGRNVIVEKGFGHPVYTRDGITILRDLFFSDRSKNMGTQAITKASDSSNAIAGDGSTQAGMLTYLVLENGVKAIRGGKHPMDVSETITQDSYKLLDALKTMAVPVKDEELKNVATVSAGDPLIGQLIAEAILYVGQDGGILTEKAPITEIQREYVDGYYMQSGFTALQSGKKEIVDPLVVVSSKRLSSAADAIEIMNGIVVAKGLREGQIPRVLFVGNIEDAAYNTIVNTINAGQIDAVIIKTPPMYGELGKYLLEDVAIYAGCEPLTENTNLKEFVRTRDGKPYSPFVGVVDKVIANKSEATLFADSETPAILERVAQIKSQIESEEIPAVAEKLKDRVAKLEGKIALFKIGAPIDATREEIEFRLEDAINSTRHAYAEGIVPGGGVTLLELSKLEGLSDITRNALRSMFKQLLLNANLPAELKLDEALKAKKGYGYNLRKSAELVDVMKDGVVDPYRVVKEIILHATGMAQEAIKAGLGLVFEDTVKPA